MSNKLLITGGCGFIGTNATLHFLNKGYDVHIIDNLSRETSIKNKVIIDETDAIVHIGDIRDKKFIDEIIAKNNFVAVIHLAAQVAVTTSISNPYDDFEINVLGTLNILEGIRLFSPDTKFINASTNKVYGNLSDKKIILTDNGYFYEDLLGIDESQPLSFYTPYGCSKGAADQYVIDYSRIYNLKTYTFRQSCIYGAYQYGIEDQGWISWFLLAASRSHQITVYGDGNQTRDVLYVNDLIRLYDNAILSDDFYGNEYNVGGGGNNYISVNNVLNFIKNKYHNLNIKFDDWRPGDQKVFIADINKAKSHFNWEPEVSVIDGLNKIADWCAELK